MTATHEKHEPGYVESGASSDIEVSQAGQAMHAGDDNFEVFKKGEGVDFRTVGWLKAAAIFLKIIFATGVLAIPVSMNALGAVPGVINVVGWCALNTYSGVILGNFRNRHAGCHSVADMAQKVGGPILREIVGFLFVITWTIVAGSAFIGSSAAFNALSNHALCTNYFVLIVTFIVIIFASARKFETIGWFTMAGFLSIFVAILVVVIGVSLVDRPAAAPQEGPFDLGFQVIGHPTFAMGITAAATIFCSGAGTSAMLPVISEMKRPQDFKKSLYLCMSIVTASYTAFSLIVYYYCGQYIASPSLGSASPLLKKVAYGIGILGLLVTAILYVHVAAKYCFVRILRGTYHLQNNTPIHFAVWFGCTIGLSALSFILAQSIPIFDYVLALAGAVGFAPIAIILPAYLYMWDYSQYRTGTMIQKIKYYLHVVMLLIGVFMLVGGTYGVVQNIIDAYASGRIGKAFSCADNSGTVKQ